MAKSTVEQVLADALTLDERERAMIASELLASLDDNVDDDAEAAWAAEIEKRVAEARDGQSDPQPWPLVRDRLRAELTDD